MNINTHLSDINIYFIGLFYDTVNNEIGAEMAYLEANKLNQANAWSGARSAAAGDDDMSKDKKDHDITDGMLSFFYTLSRSRSLLVCMYC